MEKQNKFKIIIPSYNNEEWVEYNLASILNQTYTNYEVIYIDDASTDNTHKKVMEVVGELSNWIVIKNPKNMGAMYNYFHNLNKYIKDNSEIVIHLDGDDWLYDETVLEKLNTFYNKKDCWMTYGGFIAWNGPDVEPTLPYPQSTEHPEFIHNNKMYRQDHWRASHLRTYRAFLLQAVKLEDLKSLIDGKYYWHASDLAWQYPCMEMCPKDKIQLIDFYAHVYNHSQSNRVRTHERECNTNVKYETEIRNRKKYKEGLSGEKLPQVNVIGNFQETNYIPKEFSFVYGLEEGEFDATLITDMDLLLYLKRERSLPKGKIIADLHESPTYNPIQAEIYDLVYKNYKMFDLILTHNKKLLSLPNAKLRLCMERCLNKNIHTKEWPQLADNSLYNLYEKTKNLSCISSNKSFLEGHRKRLEFVNHIIKTTPNEDLDMFGIGFNPIQGKIEGLKDYRFSIAIENGYAYNEATEKISDCFLTGTIPIYYGCPNIGDYFDIDGIITFETKEELESIIKDVILNGEQIYKSKFESIKNNFKLVNKYSLNIDQIFTQHIKPIL
jgi:glycosyltransferase involved in cell wall biosynthesis